MFGACKGCAARSSLGNSHTKICDFHKLTCTASDIADDEVLPLLIIRNVKTSEKSIPLLRAKMSQKKP